MFIQACEKTSHIVFAREGLVKCVWWLDKVQNCLGLAVGGSVLVATLHGAQLLALSEMVQKFIGVPLFKVSKIYK